MARRTEWIVSAFEKYSLVAIATNYGRLDTVSEPAMDGGCAGEAVGRIRLREGVATELSTGGYTKVNRFRYLAAIVAAAPVVSAMLLCPPRAIATEGGIGHSLPGTTIGPYAGVVPPTPGWLFSATELYYSGEFGKSAQVPIGGQINADLTAKVDFLLAGGTYIWPTKSPKVNYASAISIPLAWVDVDAGLTGPLGHQVGKSDSTFGLSDILIVPVVIGWHLSPVEHVSLSFPIWTPTGGYSSGNLANAGLNYWSFTPSLSYTVISPKTGGEFDALVGFDFNTENPSTHYTSGTMFRFETEYLQRTKTGTGYGLLFSWFDQISDDTGSVADKLDGFKGRQLGVGPLVSWKAVASKKEIDMNFRWMYQFEAVNQPKGNLFQFNLACKL